MPHTRTHTHTPHTLLCCTHVRARTHTHTHTHRFIWVLQNGALLVFTICWVAVLDYMAYMFTCAWGGDNTHVHWSSVGAQRVRVRGCWWSLRARPWQQVQLTRARCDARVRPCCCMQPSFSLCAPTSTRPPVYLCLCCCARVRDGLQCVRPCRT
jgi:hypothetical protein